MGPGSYPIRNPTAGAIAINGKCITYVGTNDGVQAFIGSKTRVIDLKGQMLLPGFIESHIHPTAALITAGADLQFDSVGQVLASAKKWADAKSSKDNLLDCGGYEASFKSIRGKVIVVDCALIGERR